MTDPLILLPAPRQLTLLPGTLPLDSPRLILLAAEHPQQLRSAAARLQAAMDCEYCSPWEVVASPAVPSGLVGIVLQVTPDPAIPAQGYRLTITPEQAIVRASTSAGAFYGACTLAQIIDQASPALPCLEISDWPDIPARGVMLDVSRDKVPTLQTLLALVDLLAGMKVNQLQLYTEHTFAYHNHPTAWTGASPVTGQDILDLDAYCRERFIDLVPNQNSFGHLRNWLVLPAYEGLAETLEPFQTPWGLEDGPFSLCPILPESLDFVRSLFDELLPHFSSRMVNVGCDETFDVGQGRSREVVAKLGADQVYLDFLMKIYNEVRAHGRTMQFWGDMVVERPEYLARVPGDSIALEWGYEAIHPFEDRSARYAAAGVPFYLCPGTSSWLSFAGRTDNALGNIASAAQSGLRFGAAGLLNTDWGDRGHWQFLPVSYLGFAAGAAYAWCWEANRSLDLASATGQFAFRDPSGCFGRAAYDLGNVYQAPGILIENASLLFWVMYWPLTAIGSFGDATPATFERTLEAIDAALQPLATARPEGPDADLVRQEYELTTRLMRHACRRGLYGLAPTESGRRLLASDLEEILPEYQRLWLARNRPGGLEHSLSLFETARKEYQA